MSIITTFFDSLSIFLAKSGMTTSGPFVDTYGLAGYEPNFTNNQHLLALTENPHPHGAQVVYGSSSSNPSWASTQNFTEEANAHNCRNPLAQQHVYLQRAKQTRFELVQQAGFERAAQKYEQAARGEVHVAVAQAADMAGAEMLAKMGALVQRFEQSWISHQVILLDEMSSVAGDALENQIRSLLSEGNAELPRHVGQRRGHLQEYQQDVQHVTEVQTEVRSHQVASGKEVGTFETCVGSVFS